MKTPKKETIDHLRKSVPALEDAAQCLSDGVKACIDVYIKDLTSYRDALNGTIEDKDILDEIVSSLSDLVEPATSALTIWNILYALQFSNQGDNQ